MTGKQASGVGRQAIYILHFAFCILHFAFVCVAIFVDTAVTIAADNPDEQKQEQRAQLLEQMRALAHATNVRFQEGDRQPKFVDSPVFRYDDQPRGFLDATMWVWTDNGRPVAFEKIDAMPHAWQFCLTCVADDLLAVKWGNGHEYRSTSQALNFLPLADAPAAPERSAARKLGVRKLVRDFSARILTDAGTNNSQEMRLLPKPIYEYADPQSTICCGAVFGFATNGTNPDLLVVLEMRTEPEQRTSRWRYAAARMTTGGVTLNHRETTVAEFAYVEPQPAGFRTWTFFATPRPAGDEPADIDSKPSAAKPKTN